jgi:hypothetical protein
MREEEDEVWKERMLWGWDSDTFEAVKSLSPAARSMGGGSSWKSSLVGESCTVLERDWEVVAEASDAASLGGGSCASSASSPSSVCSARSWSLLLAICCRRRASRRSSCGVG